MWIEDFKTVEIALKDYAKQKLLVQTLQDKIYVKEMKYAKQKQALKIIENKVVENHWNEIISLWLRDKLINQQEYDLLREVLL